MSDGSRSRTGCITCRIRKKKCDEQRPVCEACFSRQLSCYGYSEPAPAWYLNKANWKEVRESDEAKALSALAETRYKIRRKIASNTAVEPSSSTSSILDYHSEPNVLPMMIHPSLGPMSYPQQMFAQNTWQLKPESLWWDSRIQSLRAESTDNSHEETRLLMLYVDVIHPITHQFISISSPRQRTWLLNRVIRNQPLYRSALSVSACFESSLTQSPRTDEIGITPYVRGLQSAAVSALQTAIDRYVSTNNMPVEDFINEGIDLLDAVFGLLNLELFSMLQGCWEMHFKATRTLLNHVTTCRPNSDTHPSGNMDCNITTALKTWPADDERRHTLEFCILNYIWVDIIATSIFGIYSYDPCAFDYLLLIETETVHTENIMGCYGSVVILIAKITRLEEWKHKACLEGLESEIQGELQSRAQVLAAELHSESNLIEAPPNPDSLTAAHHQHMNQDITLLSQLFACAARILLQTITDPPTATRGIDQTHVNTCLAHLEALPTRLIIRCTWSYTISGCMAVSEAQHARFRAVVARCMQDSQPPGMSWKGLMVMEECWRVRAEENDQRIGWREAMKRMDARILLL